MILTLPLRISALGPVFSLAQGEWKRVSDPDKHSIIEVWKFGFAMSNTNSAGVSISCENTVTEILDPVFNKPTCQLILVEQTLY